MLVALADHGFTPDRDRGAGSPTSSAPGLGAGGAGRRAARRRLPLPGRHRGLPGGSCPARSAAGRQRCPPTTTGWDALALAAVTRGPRGGQVRPRPRPSGAQGHRPAHAGADRDRRRKRTCAARTCACSRRSAGFTRRCSAARCRSTAAGTCGRRPRRPRAARRAAARASRCWPAPPGCWASWPRNGAARSAWTSTSRSSTTPNTCPRALTRDADRAGSRHGHRRRGHRIDAPPVLLPGQHATGADRPPFADEWVAKIEAFRETLTRARPDVLVMVGSDHFHQLWLDNMPQFLVGKAPFYDANFYNEEREFGLPRMFAARATRTCPGTCCARAWTPTSTWRSATNCGSTTASRCPLITLRPQSGPADRPRLHQHLRAADAAAEAVRRAGPDHPAAGRVVAERPAGGHHRHRSPVAGARRAAPVRPARPRPRVRPQGGRLDRRRATSTAALAEVSLDSLWLPGNATHGLHGLHADDGRGWRRT